jgi:hypothetical protein
MKAAWDQRYSVREYIYGTFPNAFFKEYIDGVKPGTILTPAEGEGRNAVYAAIKQWKVFALDFSAAAQEKAFKLAIENHVEISYELADLTSWDQPVQADCIALIYAHFKPESRKSIHQKLITKLKPGGKLILESFSKKQLQYSSGGPKDIGMLYDRQTLLDDFTILEIELLEEKIIELSEGSFHNGPASVIRMIAKKSYK